MQTQVDQSAFHCNSTFQTARNSMSHILKAKQRAMHCTHIACMTFLCMCMQCMCTCVLVCVCMRCDVRCKRFTTRIRSSQNTCQWSCPGSSVLHRPTQCHHIGKISQLHRQQNQHQPLQPHPVHLLSSWWSQTFHTSCRPGKMHTCRIRVSNRNLKSH